MSRHEKKRGHGCLGFTLTLILAAAAIFAVLFFTTNVFDGLKGSVYGVFYPRKYSAEVEKYSREFDVDESLVYAVIRTESGFREEVESYAGAVGLMQLMPGTFEWLQGMKDGEVVYTADSLKDPDVNIRYGVYFLSYLIDRYGSESTACAAYNAGTTTVDGWLSDAAYSSDGATLTSIPYSETDSYVKKVMDAKAMYKKLYCSTQK